jgi:hypothetical protein
MESEVKMTTEMVVLPKATYSLLHQLTGETHPDRALSLAIKDLIRLKVDEVEKKIQAFEQKYGMDFALFDQKMQAEEILDSYSYEVEQDYLYWEAALSDRKAFRKLAKWQA